MFQNPFVLTNLTILKILSFWTASGIIKDVYSSPKKLISANFYKFQPSHSTVGCPDKGVGVA